MAKSWFDGEDWKLMLVDPETGEEIPIEVNKGDFLLAPDEDAKPISLNISSVRVTIDASGPEFDGLWAALERRWPAWQRWLTALLGRDWRN